MRLSTKASLTGVHDSRGPMGRVLVAQAGAGLLITLPGLSDVTYSLEKEEGAVTCRKVVREQNEMHTTP